MHQILLILVATIGFSTLNTSASGQNESDYKKIDSIIYSYKPRGLTTKKIKQENSILKYVYYKKVGGVFAVQLMQFNRDSLNIYTYYFIKDEVAKIVVSIQRVSHFRLVKSLGRYYFNNEQLIWKDEKSIKYENLDLLLNQAKQYLVDARQWDINWR